MSDPVQVAVDGPAASGKSSAAKRLARALAWLYLDSGAVYRAVTLAAMSGLELRGPGLAGRLDGLGIELRPAPEGLGCRVFSGGRDVSGAIRAQEVGPATKPVADDPRVRDWVTGYLRRLAAGTSVVMDGRDVGSVIFPRARFKFFVTASLEARTARRLAEARATGEQADEESVRRALAARDEADRTRPVGALVQMPDAVGIDNSLLTLEQTVDRMLRAVREGMARDRR